ncbi:helix-turn-helix domain-containing protein [Nonomuraea sp. NPDC050404]|uniref:TetR/AcrR family transcriptional regulator n=1 Tax=Nonomuraea sp. NPDC050404 TaxID=3155783 RepID=UPI0033DB95DD
MVVERRRLESRVRSRTRQAIIRAAVEVLGVDSAASLSDIADAAGVSRTTVHRYFAERADLLEAISQDALERFALGAERADLDTGSAAEALDRLCQELFELGDVVLLLFSEPQLITGSEWEEENDADRAMRRVVERGHREGAIDQELSPSWVAEIVWHLLYAAWRHTKDGASKHESLRLCLHSLHKLITPATR